MPHRKRFGPVHFIAAPGKGRYPYCHSVFIEEAGVLIDPGADRKVLQELRDQGLVRMVWLTHWHEDHRTHLDLFSDVPVWIGEHDAPPVHDLEVLLDWYGLSGHEAREFFRASMLEQFNYRPRPADRLLKDGEVLDLGCVTAEVIHAPGHTPGQLAFYFREPQVLMMADVDLTPFGPSYGDRDSSIEQTVSTVERLRKVPARVWLTSHEKGVFTEDPGPLWDSYLDVIQRRHDQLLEFLGERGRTREEIIKAHIVYGREREPREFYEFGEWAHMEKHLALLIRDGVVVSKEGVFFRR